MFQGCAYKTCKAKRCSQSCLLIYNLCNKNQNKSCDNCRYAYEECKQICDVIETDTLKYKDDWRCH